MQMQQIIRVIFFICFPRIPENFLLALYHSCDAISSKTYWKDAQIIFIDILFHSGYPIRVR